MVFQQLPLVLLEDCIYLSIWAYRLQSDRV